MNDLKILTWKIALLLLAIRPYVQLKISLFQLLRFITFTERLYCRSSCLISSRQAAMYLPSWSLLFRIPLNSKDIKEWWVLNVERVPDQVVQVLVEHPLQVTLHLLQGHDCRPCSEIAWAMYLHPEESTASRSCCWDDQGWQDNVYLNRWVFTPIADIWQPRKCIFAIWVCKSLPIQRNITGPKNDSFVHCMRRSRRAEGRDRLCQVTLVATAAESCRSGGR